MAVATLVSEADNHLAHDLEYRTALKDWESFVLSTTETVSGIDETIPELPVKDVSFRIYRDTRFTKDPTPYKVRTAKPPIQSDTADLSIASLLRCLVSHRSERPLRLLLRALRAQQVLHRRRHLASRVG